MSKTAYVDRIEASKILKVSTRTVDRYMRKHKFKTRKDGRRVLIKKIDVDKIIKEHIGKMVDLEGGNLDTILNKEPKKKESSLAVKDIKVKKVKKSANLGNEEAVYKDLYSEVKKELGEKQERLEAATYRVGQLESQVKGMVPMIEFNKTNKALKSANTLIETNAKKTEETVRVMENKLRSERVAKYIYLSLVGLLLVAEPILFVMWAFA